MAILAYTVLFVCLVTASVVESDGFLSYSSRTKNYKGDGSKDSVSFLSHLFKRLEGLQGAMGKRKRGYSLGLDDNKRDYYKISERDQQAIDWDWPPEV